MATAIDPTLLSTSQTRVFTLEGGAGPGASALYQGRGRALGVDWPGGDITPIRGPSSRRYGDYDTVAKTRGQQGLPSMSLEIREKRDVDDMLTLFQKRCTVDIQLHAGNCQDPTDFLQYDRVRILEGAVMTNFGTAEQGAFDGDQESPVLDTLPFTGDDLYDVVPIRDGAIASTEIVQEIVGLSICDGVSCGNCGAPSDGASVVFAVTKSHGGSPGLPAEVIFTADAGQTFGQTNIDTLLATEDPTDLACVGSNVVVISAESNSLHYAPAGDILLAQETWVEMTTGFVSTKTPNRIFSRGRTFTWIAAAGGYIYFSPDITADVQVQTDGSITAQNLADIHGSDDTNLIAVGASNAVLVTTNGGGSWAAVTGPNVGVALTACWMLSPSTWLIGDAGGNLWYTRDAGATWTLRAFNGSGSGTVQAIAFATPSVGFISHTLAGQGYILRTIDGGASWARVPDGGNLATITTNDKLNRLAVADSAPSNVKANLVWAGGLGADASDGIMLKAA